MHAAATRGCRVTTATISRAQARAGPRAGGRGGARRIASTCSCATTASFGGRHTKIVSIEMLEAVGEEYWPVFFATCDRLLEPGGSIGLQTITMPHRRYLASRHAYTWMHKYIFPGGLIPSREAIDRGTARRLVAARHPPRRDRPPLRHHPADVAPALPGPARAGARARLRPHASCGCGSSTWPTARPDSRPARSETSSCGWRAREARRRQPGVGDRRLERDRRRARARAGGPRRAGWRRARAGRNCWRSWPQPRRARSCRSRST